MNLYENLLKLCRDPAYCLYLGWINESIAQVVCPLSLSGEWINTHTHTHKSKSESDMIIDPTLVMEEDWKKDKEQDVINLPFQT